MPKATILFADNDPDFLKARTEFLKQEGYEVIWATNPTEARRILERGGIDLAILDIRLVNDQDEKDTSGLDIAKEVAPQVPKIILTNYPDYQYVRESLRPQVAGLPAVVDFVAKEEGPEALLQAIKKAIGFVAIWLRQAIDISAQQLERDYEEARRQSRMNYGASLIVAVIGIGLIFMGIVLVFVGRLSAGVASGVGGAVTQAITFLFYKRVDIANTRMDRYRAESMQIKKFETLLAACEEITSHEKREDCKERIIDSVRIFWFGDYGHGKILGNRENERVSGQT